MKTSFPIPSLMPRSSAPALRRSSAFTLIELITVIAIIAVLAALIIPITGAVNKQKILKRARGELSQVQTAIGWYKESSAITRPTTRACGPRTSFTTNCWAPSWSRPPQATPPLIKHSTAARRLLPPPSARSSPVSAASPIAPGARGVMKGTTRRSSSKGSRRANSWPSQPSPQSGPPWEAPFWTGRASFWTEPPAARSIPGVTIHPTRSRTRTPTISGWM